jgi:hypothetical protein
LRSFIGQGLIPRNSVGWISGLLSTDVNAVESVRRAED